MVIDRFELIHDASAQSLVEQVVEDIGAVSPETQVVPRTITLQNARDFEAVYAALFDLAKTCPFEPEEEDYWIHIKTGTHVVQICMFLLTEARFFPGRLVQTSPPRRQGPGEPGTYALIDLDLSRCDQIAQRFSREQVEGVAFLKSGIATRNARFNAMIDEIERVAIKSRAPMLLTGPTGACKSFLARGVYELMKARHQIDGKFIELYCATLRGDGAASTLFGHTKGAFTGAASDRPGLLRSAHRGLLFLDEIGELGLDKRAMLLQAVEDKRFLPVGSDNEVQSEFQLIAGTNRDLAQEVVAGRFREDLHARINLWTYVLPGLREQAEDIEPNLGYLLAQFSEENGQMVRMNREARERCMKFASSPSALWTGNFRDLLASVTRMATLADGGGITEAIVDQEIRRLQSQWQRMARPSDTKDVTLAELMAQEQVDGLDLCVSRDAKSKPNVPTGSRNISPASGLPGTRSAARQTKVIARGYHVVAGVRLSVQLARTCSWHPKILAP